MKDKFFLLSAFCILLSAFCSLPSALAQYAPQAGITGSDAIAASSSSIVDWANGCTIHRGYLDIDQPSLGLVSSGDSSLAVGAADNFVVSLGDSGVALLTFPHPITNGPGADFAVFENGFLNPANPEEAFLELAFVEVSSDGINFFRFLSSSLTQDTTQISSIAGLNYMNARNINNLAGKYIANYGTPFDLQELSGIAGLDINHITQVRIVDVIGSIDKHASFDSYNRIINDPYPTAFPTGGFDLDAVAVLHENVAAGIHELEQKQVLVYPNPTTNFIQIKTSEKLQVVLIDVFGKVLWENTIDNTTQVSLQEYNTGIYLLRFTNQDGKTWAERITKL